MELAVEGRREDSVAVDYYLFLLLSKTLRSVVTIDMFYLTRCSRGVSINGEACYVFLRVEMFCFQNMLSIIRVDAKKNSVLS